MGVGYEALLMRIVNLGLVVHAGVADVRRLIGRRRSASATLTLRNDFVTLAPMNVFAFFSDPTRLEIVELLADSGELPAGKIAERFAMTRAGVSRHLRTLEDAGVLIVRLEAQRRLYRLNPEPFRDLDAWLHKYRRFWNMACPRGTIKALRESRRR